MDRCRATVDEAIPGGSRIITSDDVFDMMLDIRSINEGIDRRREKLAEDYYDLKHEEQGYTHNLLPEGAEKPTVWGYELISKEYM